MAPNHNLNPSLKHASILKAICTPLETHGITFFGYTAVDSKSQAYCLGSKVDYAENYLRRSLAQNDIHHFDEIRRNSPQYFFWDYADLNAENETLYRIANEFDQSHTLTITRTSENLLQCYHFSGQNQNDQLNQYYSENLDALHLYIDYFDDCLKNIPELTETFQHPVSIHRKSMTYQPYVYTKANLSIEELTQITGPFVLAQANRFLLTDQERECLRWMHKAKSYDMIASIMQVNRKTIERYVTSIKEKYQCYTLFQLGEKIAERKLSPLLNLA